MNCYSPIRGSIDIFLSLLKTLVLAIDCHSLPLIYEITLIIAHRIFSYAIIEFTLIKNLLFLQLKYPIRLYVLLYSKEIIKRITIFRCIGFQSKPAMLTCADDKG